jgi:hypothetical protein
MRDNILNNKGSTSLIGLSFTLLFSLFLIFYLQKLKLEHQELKYRTQAYLCYQYLNNETLNYIDSIGSFNQAIRVLFMGEITIILASESYEAINELKMLRKLAHLSYLKNISANTKCEFKQAKDYIINLPYKMTSPIEFEEIFDGTTILKSNIWNNHIKNFMNKGKQCLSNRNKIFFKKLSRHQFKKSLFRKKANGFFELEALFYTSILLLMTLTYLNINNFFNFKNRQLTKEFKDEWSRNSVYEKHWP